MASSFLDTTVLVELAKPLTSERAASEKFVASNQPSHVAEYAFRELLAGLIRYHCDAHNILIAAVDPMEAVLATSQRFFRQPRRNAAVIGILGQIFSTIFGTGMSGSGAEFKREGLQAIMLKTASLWNRAKKAKNVARTQPLACFNEGQITLGAGGLLRAPNDHFDCLVKQRCAAAGYLHDNLSAVKTLIAALHPDNLSAQAASKSENGQRRKALKDLEKRGPKEFSKARCRALGDAYFAIMCPLGATIGTTNLSDFEPLCEALGKAVAKP